MITFPSLIKMPAGKVSAANESAPARQELEEDARSGAAT
jgi:hypothetical protein